MRQASLTGLAALVGCVGLGWALPFDCDKTDRDGCRWSEWTDQCLVPDSRINSKWKQLLYNAGRKGCIMPDALTSLTLEREVPKYLRQAFDGALLKRMDALQGRQCGGCSIKARCCNSATAFLNQAWQAAPCGGEAPEPCPFQPLSRQEIANHHAKVKKDWTERYYKLSKKKCNFSQFIPYKRFREQAGGAPKYTLVGMGFCSLFGSLRPRIKCQYSRSRDMCFCCCPRYRYSRSAKACVPYDSYRNEKCNRQEKEPRSCQKFRRTKDWFLSEIFSDTRRN